MRYFTWKMRNLFASAFNVIIEECPSRLLTWGGCLVSQIVSSRFLWEFALRLGVEYISFLKFLKPKLWVFHIHPNLSGDSTSGAHSHRLRISPELCFFCSNSQCYRKMLLFFAHRLIKNLTRNYLKRNVKSLTPARKLQSVYMHGPFTWAPRTFCVIF
jgi:hypothetical protein